MSTIVPGRFCWQELATRDVEQAVDFYGALFGWKSERRDMGEHGVYHLMKLDGKDVCGMYQMGGPMFEGVPPHWASYVKVSSADDTAAKVQKLGGKLHMPPMDIPEVGRMVAFADPQGASLNAFQEGDKCGKQLGDDAMHGFCWSELMTNDVAGAKAFYTKLFGWDTHDQPMGAGCGTYTLWMHDGEHAGGAMAIQKEWGEVPPYWLNYVTVADVDAATSKAAKLGANVIVPRMEIPETGSFTMIADPTGAHVCLFEHLPKAGC
jgi:hypothetical protein